MSLITNFCPDAIPLSHSDITGGGGERGGKGGSKWKTDNFHTFRKCPNIIYFYFVLHVFYCGHSGVFFNVSGILAVHHTAPRQDGLLDERKKNCTQLFHKGFGNIIFRENWKGWTAILLGCNPMTHAVFFY